jgi:hypothetical protein
MVSARDALTPLREGNREHSLEMGVVEFFDAAPGAV